MGIPPQEMKAIVGLLLVAVALVASEGGVDDGVKWPVPLDAMDAADQTRFPDVYKAKDVPTNFADADVAKLLNQVAAHAGKLQTRLNKLGNGPPQGKDAACLAHATSCEKTAPMCAQQGSAYSACRPLLVACMAAVNSCKLSVKLKHNKVVGEALNLQNKAKKAKRSESTNQRIEDIVNTVFPADPVEAHKHDE